MRIKSKNNCRKHSRKFLYNLILPSEIREITQKDEQPQLLSFMGKEKPIHKIR
jgi:hypothetical protein